MPLTKENLARLIALQEQDAALDKLKAEMDKVPVEIAALREELAGEKAKASGAKNQLLTLEKKKKEKELELAQKEDAVKKHGAELNQVKTNDAFKALQQEIERAKAAGSQIETEILETMDELDRVRKEDKAVQAELAGVEKKINGEIAAAEAKLAEIKGRFDAAKVVRDQAAAPLPAEATKIYNHVRSRGKLNAVVPIENNNCSACRIALAPQVIVEATKAKALVACESCQRILYRPEVLALKAA